MNKGTDNVEMYRTLRDELSRELRADMLQHYRKLEVALREIAAEEAGLEYERRESQPRHGGKKREPREPVSLGGFRVPHRAIVAAAAAMIASLAWLAATLWLGRAADSQPGPEATQTDAAQVPPKSDVDDDR